MAARYQASSSKDGIKQGKILGRQSLSSSCHVLEVVK